MNLPRPALRTPHLAPLEPHVLEQGLDRIEDRGCNGCAVAIGVEPDPAARRSLL